jgi:hypothetical protein
MKGGMMKKIESVLLAIAWLLILTACVVIAQG